MVATLVLAGPRILELSLLDRPDLDLAARETRISRVKTDASERTVPMLPALHEILLAQSAERRSAKGPAFVTSNGTRQHPDNIRAHLLSGVLERANELLAKADEQPIGHMTPHTFRRTFASLLAEIGVEPAACDVSARPHGPEVHDARLPTGPGSRRSGAPAA